MSQTQEIIEYLLEKNLITEPFTPKEVKDAYSKLDAQIKQGKNFTIANDTINPKLSRMDLRNAIFMSRIRKDTSVNEYFKI